MDKIRDICNEKEREKKTCKEYSEQSGNSVLKTLFISSYFFLKMNSSRFLIIKYFDCRKLCTQKVNMLYIKKYKAQR